MIYLIDMNEQELKEKLTPEQYRVMREKGAEKPFSGEYWDNNEDGIYACAACGSELFSSEDKFDSETGFPSFKKSLDPKKIELVSDPDSSDRMDIRCKNCASHLGFVIDGEEKFYRLNSTSLEFEENGDEDEEEEEESSEKKSDKINKAKSLAKNITMLAATAAVSLAVGASAGLLICRNSTIAPDPSPSAERVRSTVAETKTITSTSAPKTSLTPVPPRSTTPLPSPKASDGTAPSSDGTTP